MHASFNTLIEQYPLPIAAQLRCWAARYSTQTALVDDGGALTYSELDVRVDQLAAGLDSLGLRSGQHVIVQLPNGNAFVILLFALLRLGAIPVLAMPSQRELDIDALIALAQPVAYFIHGENHAGMARQMMHKHACLRHVLTIEQCADDDFTPLFSLRGELQAWRQPEVSATALLLLSGGTTGTPKLIPRRHADYSYNFSASAELCGINAQSVYLAVLPVAHNFPLACPGILGTLACGGKVVLTNSASCDEVMPLIAECRATHVALVPALAQLWAQAREWEESDLSSLRVIQVGGARLDPTLAEQIIATFNCTLQQVFGMAEGLVNYTRLNDSPERIINTQGCPMCPDDEVWVADAQGNPLPRGEVGRLMTRGPYTFRGYYKSPQHNAEAFDADGFYCSGDLISIDEDGYITVQGREKDQINRGGEKIAAEEIENLLLRHPAVIHVALVSMEDSLLGEKSCAYLVVKEPLRAVAVRRFLREQGVAEFKLPDRVECVDALPLTPVGKVDKK
ncbi:(2,3-dihydroxybenzoyl)adenylate synthase, partial [Aeromonas caviae]